MTFAILEDKNKSVRRQSPERGGASRVKSAPAASLRQVGSTSKSSSAAAANAKRPVTVVPSSRPKTGGRFRF